MFYLHLRYSHFTRIADKWNLPDLLPGLRSGLSKTSAAGPVDGPSIANAILTIRHLIATTSSNELPVEPEHLRIAEVSDWRSLAYREDTEVFQIPTGIERVPTSCWPFWYDTVGFAPSKALISSGTSSSPKNRRAAGE